MARFRLNRFFKRVVQRKCYFLAEFGCTFEEGKALAGKSHHSLVLTYLLGRLEVFLLYSETKQPDFLQHW